MDKSNKLGTHSVGKLLVAYSIPAVIAMMVNAIYNVVDRMFIGKYVGESALAGLTIVFPAMMLIFAFAGLVGQGGAALVSIRLGEKNKRGANQVFSNMLMLSVVVSGLIAALLYFNLESILQFFGATDSTLSHAQSYMSIILVGVIFQMVSFSLNGIVRSEGFPILSMASMMAAAVVNIVLDYLFIAKLGWGVEGAAYGTIIGQFVGFMILAQYFIRGKSQLRVLIKEVKVELSIIGQILSIGATTFLTTAGTSVAMLVLNWSLARYGGIAAVTSMGAINSLFTLFIMPIMGIQQGVQPIIGYNHGARESARVKKTLIYAMTIAITFSTVVFIGLQFFPKPLVSMFLDPDSTTMEVAVNGLKIFTLALPVLSINLLGTSYFQSIAVGKKALFLGASRQFLYLIPLALLLSQFYGLKGVWYATPIADLLAVISTLILLVPAVKAYSDKEQTNDKEGKTQIAEVA